MLLKSDPVDSLWLASVFSGLWSAWQFAPELTVSSLLGNVSMSFKFFSVPINLQMGVVMNLNIYSVWSSQF